MTILDEVRETFKNVELDAEFTTAEIKEMLCLKFGRNKSSVIPSDYK